MTKRSRAGRTRTSYPAGLETTHMPLPDFWRRGNTSECSSGVGTPGCSAFLESLPRASSAVSWLSPSRGVTTGPPLCHRPICNTVDTLGCNTKLSDYKVEGTMVVPVMQKHATTVAAAPRSMAKSDEPKTVLQSLPRPREDARKKVVQFSDDHCVTAAS